MATFTGTSLIGPSDATPGVGLAAGLKAKAVTVTIPGTVAAADIITGPVVPKGALLVDVILDITDIDTAGSPTATVQVGVTGTAAAYIATNNAPRTGGRARADVAGALPAVMTADTTIIATLAGAIATAAAGTATITVYFVPANS